MISINKIVWFVSTKAGPTPHKPPNNPPRDPPLYVRLLVLAHRQLQHVEGVARPQHPRHLLLLLLVLRGVVGHGESWEGLDRSMIRSDQEAAAAIVRSDQIWSRSPRPVPQGAHASELLVVVVCRPALSIPCHVHAASPKRVAEASVSEWAGPSFFLGSLVCPCLWR